MNKFFGPTFCPGLIPIEPPRREKLPKMKSGLMVFSPFWQFLAIFWKFFSVFFCFEKKIFKKYRLLFFKIRLKIGQKFDDIHGLVRSSGIALEKSIIHES